MWRRNVYAPVYFGDAIPETAKRAIRSALDTNDPLQLVTGTLTALPPEARGCRSAHWLTAQSGPRHAATLRRTCVFVPVATLRVGMLGRAALRDTDTVTAAAPTAPTAPAMTTPATTLLRVFRFRLRLAPVAANRPNPSR